VIKNIIILVVFLFSASFVFAEERDPSSGSKLPIELESEFPSNLIGTYCETESDAYQIIYDYGVLYISEDFLSFDKALIFSISFETPRVARVCITILLLLNC